MNAFRQAFPELSKLRTACITDGFPLTLAHDFEALKVDALSTGKDHVSPDLVADCQRRGIKVWAWTVNSMHFMERLMVSFFFFADRARVQVSFKDPLFFLILSFVEHSGLRKS